MARNQGIYSHRRPGNTVATAMPPLPLLPP